MTFATNFITAVLSGALAEEITMIDGSWWEASLASFFTGFVVMSVLIRVNPKP